MTQIPNEMALRNFRIRSCSVEQEWNRHLLSVIVYPTHAIPNPSPPCLSPHRLPDQFRLGFRQNRIGCFAVNLFAANLKHYRNGERRNMVERLVNDASLDAREHLAEAAHVEEAGDGIGARGAKKEMVGLMLAQHVVDEVGRNRQFAA